MINISKTVETLPPSGIRAFFDLVIGMKDVISLGVGEPDFVTPWNICEAGINSIEQGMTSYTSNKGLKELRVAITDHIYRTQKIKYDPDEEILITVGVSEALDLVARAILNPGDEVLIPEPAFGAYNAVVTLAGGKSVFIQTKAENQFKLSPEDIDKACTKKTKAILLNYPANPTGVSYTKQELEKIYKTIQKNNIIAITDEVYDELSYDFKHTPWATLKGAKSNSIYLNGFSKAYAMTGWRIGYITGPKEVIDAATKIHQYTMMCVPTASQVAAIEAIQHGQKSVHQMFEEYKRRRNFIVSNLNRIGLKCHMPQGAFYVMPSIKSSGLDSVEFSSRLLKTQKVAVVPGTAFSTSGQDYIRISYASSMEDLKEAILRMEKFLSSLK
jgi:aminotransferase